MSASPDHMAALAPAGDACCGSPGPARPASGPAGPAAGTPQWQRYARRARLLAWGSLGWMTAEGAIGLAAGLAAGSVALTGWALGSAIEGLASVIVIWRFTGTRALSETAERRAQRGVAISFWLLAPYIAAESAWNLAEGQHAGATVAGIVLTAVALAVMPLLGWAKHRLAVRLGSAATAGEGTQNYLCAAQAAAVLAGLAVVAAWPGAWPADPVVALGIAAWSAWEGRQSWRGTSCC